MSRMQGSNANVNFPQHCIPSEIALYACHVLLSKDYFQKNTKMNMFSKFHEWSTIIFDNILLLANDQKDATWKLQTFLRGTICVSEDVEVVLWL